MDATTGHFKRLASCLGKEPFASPQIANKVMRRRAKRPRYKGSKTRKVYAIDAQVYHCPHCSLFHIGAKAKSVHARRQRDQEDDGGREDMD